MTEPPTLEKSILRMLFTYLILPSHRLAIFRAGSALIHWRRDDNYTHWKPILAKPVRCKLSSGWRWRYNGSSRKVWAGVYEHAQNQSICLLLMHHFRIPNHNQALMKQIQYPLAELSLGWFWQVVSHFRELRRKHRRSGNKPWKYIMICSMSIMTRGTKRDSIA
jgi:hypothetical protein